jgi:hypothetical protein
MDHRGRIRDNYFARYPEQFPLKHVNDLKKVPGAATVLEESLLERALLK